MRSERERKEGRRRTSRFHFDDGRCSILTMRLPAPTPCRARSWLVSTTEVAAVTGVWSPPSAGIKPWRGNTYGKSVLEEELFGRNCCQLVAKGHVDRSTHGSSFLVGEEEDAGVGDAG